MLPLQTPTRFDRLDALRAVAMLWMAVFHFCFDLNHFGLYTPPQNFYGDVFWTMQRTFIVSLFLFCAGLSLAGALQAGQSWPRFWRRWVQIAGCAVLVSVGSALIFPRSWISFGVLHGIAVMLIIVRLAAPLRGWLWLLALLAILLPQSLPYLLSQPPHGTIFDGRWLNWIGLVTRKPITEDYVPVLPWLGVMLCGLAAGQWLLARKPIWMRGGLPWPARPLAILGRWSLSFYMLHQPVFFALLTAYKAIV